MNWHPLWLSLQVTAVATFLMLVIGLPLALLLARRRFPGATLLETLVSLPLVLPPTVVGYYLLLALGREIEPPAGTPDHRATSTNEVSPP